VKAFEERAKCFVDQYSNFEVVDWMDENASPNKTMKVYVDGNLTLAENTADAGGMNSAYLAWQKHEKAQGKSQLLPSLHAFTRELLFIVAYGQMWCSKVSQELLLANNKANVHAPGLARIVGATQNSVAFKEVFECKRGSQLARFSRGKSKMSRGDRWVLESETFSVCVE
jgi:endothelin-converting enzyme